MFWSTVIIVFFVIPLASIGLGLFADAVRPGRGASMFGASLCIGYAALVAWAVIW